MNRGGSTILLGLALGVVVILLALAFAPVIKQFTEDARAPTTNNSVGLDCANTTLTNFEQANCVAVDVLNPYFTWILISIGIALISARIIWEVL